VLFADGLCCEASPDLAAEQVPLLLVTGQNGHLPKQL